MVLIFSKRQASVQRESGHVRLHCQSVNVKNQMKKPLEMLSSYIVINHLDDVGKFLTGYSSH